MCHFGRRFGLTGSLTTATENVTGTSGNDSISGVVDTIANGGTFNAGDTIEGGSGTDTLTLVVTDSAKFAAASVKGVENIVLRATEGATAMDLAAIEGATSISNKSSSATIAGLNNVQNAVTIKMENSTKDLLVQYASDKLASATATQAIVLNAAGDAVAATPVAAVLTLDVQGSDKITKMTIDSSTAASVVEIKGNAAGTDVALTDLTVTGNAALTLTPNATGAGKEFNGLKTIDASAMTAGGLSLNNSLQSADLTTSFKGGAGNDKFTLDSTHITTADVVTGGEGTDTFGMYLAGAAASVAADASLIAVGAAAKVTGFEVLNVTSAAKAIKTAFTLTVDASAVAGVNKVVIGSDLGNAADSVTSITNLDNNGIVTIESAQTGITAFTIKPSTISAGGTIANTLEIGKAKAAGVTVVAVQATQTNELTIKSSGTSINTITELTAAENTALKKIAVTGDIELKITNDLAVKNLTSVDASGLVLKTTTENGLTMGAAPTFNATTTTGLTITGSNAVDTIKGSALGDTIKGGTGADTLTLGTAGKTDTLLYTATSDSTTSAKDVVTVFEGAKDLFKFVGFAAAGTFSISTTAFSGSGNASAIYANAADMSVGASDLKVDYNGDGTADFVISLVGTGALTTANFVFQA